MTDGVYGFPPQDWSNAVAEGRAILEQRALEPELMTTLTISYTDFCAELRSVRLQPDSRALAGLLDQISRASDDDQKGLLNVLVIHKDGDGMPGTGFFMLAAEKGRKVSSREECWLSELHRVVESRGGTLNGR